MLAASISAVDQTLAALRKQKPKAPAPAKEPRARKNIFKLSPEEVSSIKLDGTHAQTRARDPAFDSVRYALSAEGMKPKTLSLEEMANTIEPIIDTFDDVLVRNSRAPLYGKLTTWNGRGNHT